MTNEPSKTKTTSETPALRRLGPLVSAALSAYKTIVAALALILLVSEASAATFSFSTGNPDGLMATASRPGPTNGVDQETESGDDFILTNEVQITSASFTGLVPLGVDVSNDVSQVVVEIYRVFPQDSDTNRTI